MGHIVNPDREYRLLQQKLDKFITGAPESPVFTKILKILFSPQDAEFARRIPFQLTPIEALSKKFKIPKEKLYDKLTQLAHKGLVVDIEYEGQRYFTLAPVVIGFFEFTFMRTREDLPIKELVYLFDEYMSQNDKFVHSVFGGQTQIGRTLVYEESLKAHTEILDWERASHIIKSAKSIGLSLCACRHKASHLGKNCERELKTCLSFNYAADTVIRNGFAESITTDSAMRILEYSKEVGIAQTGDNVQRNVTYICNCCGCCCGMMQAIKKFEIRNAIVSSNWITEIDMLKCKGCGKCVKACPLQAITLVPKNEGDKKQNIANRDETLCLGCGVCYTACKFGSITMKHRQKRVFTPETVFDKIITMAIERGKLAGMIFDDPESLSHRALGRIFSVIEKSSVFKNLSLKSTFVNSLVKHAKKTTGNLGNLIG